MPHLLGIDLGAGFDPDLPGLVGNQVKRRLGQCRTDHDVDLPSRQKQLHEFGILCMVGCHTSQHSATTKAKQAVIVENRPGAGGNIATVLVARSPADGYTLLLLASSLVVNPSLFKQGNYDQLQVLSLSACICYQKPLAFKSVNAKHRKTLQAIFAHPTSATVVFSHIEALVVALGGAIKEREGSRIKITLHNAQWHCHRPHPGKEAKRYQVEEARELLERLGIKP